MNTPKFFELIGSSKGESSDPHFRVFVELADEDKNFWESQARGTAEGSNDCITNRPHGRFAERDRAFGSAGRNFFRG
jgi:hypothetical protein